MPLLNKLTEGVVSMADKNWHARSAQKERFWLVHIKAWRKSGLSQNEYCRRNKLSTSRFGYWKKKINRQATPVSFVPVPIPEQKTQAGTESNESGLAVFLRNDIRIELNNNFTASTLVKVVDALGGQL
jgi:hypothetical protein